MELGLLPALGSGVADLRRSGQDARLFDGYIRPYARAFDRVWYFSYLVETLGQYTDDPDVLSTVGLLAPRRPRPRLVRALTLPLTDAAAIRRCAVLRVFQVTGVVPALVARALWAIPYVTTYGFWYSSLSHSRSSRLAKRALERVALRCAAAVIVPTEDLRAHVSRVVPATRVHLIPNGVDIARFAPRAVARADGPRILYVGRLSAEKNLGTAIAAAAKLSRRWPLRLTFIGAGPLESELRCLAAQACVTADFPGVLDHRRLPARYQDADVFVLPSFTEGHPKVLLEAMASGLPCVASDCTGNRSLLTDGETGLLFDPGDADALASRLERLFADPAFARRLGERGRARVAAEYDLGRLVEREIGLLRRVASVRIPA